MKLIMIDMVFLVALLLVANKMRYTWRSLFPKGFSHWRAEQKKLKNNPPPPEG